MMVIKTTNDISIYWRSFSVPGSTQSRCRRPGGHAALCLVLRTGVSKQQGGVRKRLLFCHVSWHLCSTSICSLPLGGFGPVHCLTTLCSALSFSISTKLDIAKVSRCGPIVYDFNKRDFSSAVYKLVPSQGVHFSTVFEWILSFFNFERSLSATRKAQ